MLKLRALSYYVNITQNILRKYETVCRKKKYYYRLTATN